MPLVAYSKEWIIISYTLSSRSYKSILTPYETQTAIGRLKRNFEDGLRAALNLHRVSAPLFVEPMTGFNDDLSGKERPVAFEIPDAKTTAQIVHSLAKWKRVALKKYGFSLGEGLYTDMNAIRRDEVLDSTHSIYVDQWDWEKIISAEDRNLGYLKEAASAIIVTICDTQEHIQALYPALTHRFSRDVAFITAQELENMYPALTPDEREHEFTKENKTVCVMQIGGKLASGKRHGSRAPDYDDWALNADLILWSDVLGEAVEISSMGIRVDEASLAAQLEEAECNHRRELLYHRMLLSGELPLTIGGGIGQSRLSMLILEKGHIGEVQVSVWDEGILDECERRGISLL